MGRVNRDSTGRIVLKGAVVHVAAGLWRVRICTAGALKADIVEQLR